MFQRLLMIICLLCGLWGKGYSQQYAAAMTLDQCISYALQHEPTINAAKVSVSIARTTNRINLSGWLPQANVSAPLTHYFELPTVLTSDTLTNGGGTTQGTYIPLHSGIENTFIPQLDVTQAIFNPQLLYAAKAAKLYVRAANQVTDSAKIYITATVSKDFYNLVGTLQEINVLKDDTARLNRNIKDTYHQFVGGIVDKTDYEEAIISFNNSYAQLRLQIDNIAPQYAMLKQAMGYPPQDQFNISVDTAQLLQDLSFDTTQRLDYTNRIEYQQLLTARKLQGQLTGYYRLAFLPTITGFYNYYQEYEGSTIHNMFNTAYPYSDIGATLTLPIFTGFARTENVHKAHLQQQLIDWAEVELKSEIYTEYATALGNYKYNYENWTLQKDNVEKAQDVYRIVTLQYKQGIVAYINVIQAESYLITAETSEVTAMYQLLSSKIDLEKAMGYIPYNR